MSDELNEGSELNQEGFTLNTQQKIMLGVQASGDFFSIIPSYYEGKAQKQAYDFKAWQENQNAAILRQNAQNILYESYEYENKVKVEGARLMGKQRTAMSASGFSVSSKSYQDLLQDTDYNIERNAAAIRREAMTKYAAMNAKAGFMDIQADLDREAGKAIRRKNKRDMITGGIMGALKLGAISYFGKSKLDSGIEDMGQTKSITSGGKFTGVVPVQPMRPTLRG